MESEYRPTPAACVTGKAIPAIVMVQLRCTQSRFSPTLYDTLPLPVSFVEDVKVIQSPPGDFVAIHAQPLPALMLMLPELPVYGYVAPDEGERE